MVRVPGGLTLETYHPTSHFRVSKISPASLPTGASLLAMSWTFKTLLVQKTQVFVTTHVSRSFFGNIDLHWWIREKTRQRLYPRKRMILNRKTSLFTIYFVATATLSCWALKRLANPEKNLFRVPFQIWGLRLGSRILLRSKVAFRTLTPLQIPPFESVFVKTKW